MIKVAIMEMCIRDRAKASVKNKERGDKKGTGVCVFQLEMGKEQLASRFLSSEALICLLYTSRCV